MPETPYRCDECLGPIPRSETHFAMPNLSVFSSRQEAQSVWRQHILCAELKDHLVTHYKGLGFYSGKRLEHIWLAVKESLNDPDGGVKDSVYLLAARYARMIGHRLVEDGTKQEDENLW